MESSAETSDSIENRAKEAKDEIEQPHSDDVPKTEVSNADFAKALTTRLAGPNPGWPLKVSCGRFACHIHKVCQLIDCLILDASL